ncbi:MAG: 50S ribosomal protein L6 [Candidatus Sungbacteria bacterium]|uniref:Large ribosomal subunit protein uL6 n=1 Tax=Candidatus Sungiibacteriota bacterium TaxID=2750080 RepID=A0A932YV79_9BACT|nr:50S ribosomal protein L6 [Candidatus Sungbacteria bacterium]
MSRIGKQPIELPAGVTVTQNGQLVSVAGPKGTLSLTLRPEVRLSADGRRVSIEPALQTRKTAAYWGLTRALVARMVEGVSRGFEKRLEIEGIGYRAALEGGALTLALGFSHPVQVEPPPGITFRVEKNVIFISGVDAALVGDVAARIRRLRPPEPYKGKGIRYSGEVIRRKAGKKAVSTGG